MVSQGCHGMHSGEILTLRHPTIDCGISDCSGVLFFFAGDCNPDAHS